RQRARHAPAAQLSAISAHGAAHHPQQGRQGGRRLRRSFGGFVSHRLDAAARNPLTPAPLPRGERGWGERRWRTALAGAGGSADLPAQELFSLPLPAAIAQLGGAAPGATRRHSDGSPPARRRTDGGYRSTRYGVEGHALLEMVTRTLPVADLRARKGCLCW